MPKKNCQFSGQCKFRDNCACSGNDHLLCNITHHIGDICFVDKQSNPTCNAKTYFGDAHICLCPAKTTSIPR